MVEILLHPLPCQFSAIRNNSAELNLVLNNLDEIIVRTIKWIHCNSCDCNEGYEFLFGTCEDINECLDNPCDDTERCSNIEGTKIFNTKARIFQRTNFLESIWGDEIQSKTCIRYEN